MGTCKFVETLSRLRKSSNASIDNDTEFDDYKKYMHVVRNVESDLKKILKEVNESNKKTLVLLCGSAGDGKSHLLSYLKNADEENLLADFDIHNDATVSSGEHKDAIDTLNEVLSGFMDANLEQPGRNLIVAINLGILSNFIESDYIKNYKQFKNYVTKNGILNDNLDVEYGKSDHFKHISFSDYQCYSLTENGPISPFIDSLFDKVFGAEEKNPFATAYKQECINCPNNTRCPVRMNYAFLRNEKRRKYITQLIIMVIVKYKMIIPTREILNFIYDITVPQNFNYSDYPVGVEISENQIVAIFNSMTPNLIFHQAGLSEILDALNDNDPVLQRTEEADDFAIEYFVTDECVNLLRTILEPTVYGKFVFDSDIKNICNNSSKLRPVLLNSYIRIKAIEEGIVRDSEYMDFMMLLYFYYTGEKKRIRKLKTLIKEAVENWCGADHDGHICFNDTNKDLLMFEKLDITGLRPVKVRVENEQDEICKFDCEITLSVKTTETKDKDIYLGIDYSLYKLLIEMQNGYIQTTNDENDHAEFVVFIDRLIAAGEAGSQVFFIDAAGNKSQITFDDDYYQFEVIK